MRVKLTGWVRVDGSSQATPAVFSGGHAPMCGYGPGEGHQRARGAGTAFYVAPDTVKRNRHSRRLHRLGELAESHVPRCVDREAQFRVSLQEPPGFDPSDW